MAEAFDLIMEQAPGFVGIRAYQQTFCHSYTFTGFSVGGHKIRDDLRFIEVAIAHIGEDTGDILTWVELIDHHPI